MTNQDPRLPRHCCSDHADYESGCAACASARGAYEKRRMLLSHRSEPVYVESLGTLRRITALMALGWPLSWIAADAGLTTRGFRSLMRRQGVTTHDTAVRVRATYDRLSMARPVGRDRFERTAISKTLARAHQHGYEPPLAWDDADLDAPLELAGAAA